MKIPMRLYLTISGDSFPPKRVLRTQLRGLLENLSENYPGRRIRRGHKVPLSWTEHLPGLNSLYFFCGDD
jgi:hypothetical protein